MSLEEIAEGASEVVLCGPLCCSFRRGTWHRVRRMTSDRGANQTLKQGGSSLRPRQEATRCPRFVSNSVAPLVCRTQSSSARTVQRSPRPHELPRSILRAACGSNRRNPPLRRWFVLVHVYSFEVPLRSSLYQISDVFSRGDDPITHAHRARCLALVGPIFNECCHCHCHSSTFPREFVERV